MLIIALLVPGRGDWTFGASSRDIEVSYNLLSYLLSSSFSSRKICSLDLSFFFFYFFTPSPFPPPYEYTHPLSLHSLFRRGRKGQGGYPFSPSFQASPPSAAKHHIQEERGERNKTDRRKKQMTRLISLGAIARIHPHALDISI